MDNALRVGVKGMESLQRREERERRWKGQFTTRMAKEFFESNAVQIS